VAPGAQRAQRAQRAQGAQGAAGGSHWDTLAVRLTWTRCLEYGNNQWGSYGDSMGFLGDSMGFYGI